MEERGRERRFERRTGRRIVAAAIVGTVAGAILGLIVGALVLRSWSAGHWAMALAGAILLGGIAAVQGGLAGLEPVDPGSEPSNQADPLRDDDRWVSPERDERSA